MAISLRGASREYQMRATAECCGYVGTLADIALHSCQIEEFGGRCEDYPCCGHTDGLGCQTTASMTSDYYTEGPGRAHLMCDHEAGWCEAWQDGEDD